MPPTATYEDIKAHQDKIEKNIITPESLPPCPRCDLESIYFKIHAYRERRFLIIVEMIVRAVFCPLVRFKCPVCRKTFTFYPDFAIPYKHYTRQSIVGFAAAYLKMDTTYEQAIMVENGAPGYLNSDVILAPSTIHRWISHLARYTETPRRALTLLRQENPTSPICRDLAQLNPTGGKFRSERRKQQLMNAQKLTIIEAFFQATFNLSIFTKLARTCGFT
jgi:transposase